MTKTMVEGKEVDIWGEIVRLGRGFMGMLSAFFDGITNFFEWVSVGHRRQIIEAEFLEVAPNVPIEPELQGVLRAPQSMEGPAKHAGYERGTPTILSMVELQAVSRWHPLKL